MLTNSLKISDTTKKEFFELMFLQINQKIWQHYCRDGLSSVLDTLTYWLATSALTQDFLVI